MLRLAAQWICRVQLRCCTRHSGSMTYQERSTTFALHDFVELSGLLLVAVGLAIVSCCNCASFYARLLNLSGLFDE